jgi:hypothetical protein
LHKKFKLDYSCFLKHQMWANFVAVVAATRLRGSDFSVTSSAPPSSTGGAAASVRGDAALML